jgi:hypothetical protein
VPSLNISDLDAPRLLNSERFINRAKTARCRTDSPHSHHLMNNNLFKCTQANSCIYNQYSLSGDIVACLTI